MNICKKVVRNLVKLTNFDMSHLSQFSLTDSGNT